MSQIDPQPLARWRRRVGMGPQGDMPAWLAFIVGGAVLTLITVLPVWLSLVLLTLAAGAAPLVGASSGLDGTSATSAPGDAARSPSRSSSPGNDRAAMLDVLPDAAILVGSNERVLHHNRLAHELFPRLSPGVPLSSRLRQPDLIEAVDQARRQDTAIEVDLTERIPVERRLTARIVRLAASANRGDDVDVLVTFRDLSEEDRLSRTRADFVANASHELRTPLAALRGFVETLQGPARNDEAARTRFLAMMSTQALRMSRLIDDLLSLSRVEMKQHVPPRERVDLNELAAEVAQTMTPMASEKNVRIELTTLADPAIVRGDRDELVQALQNLVQNAIKYGKSDGLVRIVLDRREDSRVERRRIRLAVIDDGPGIPSQHLPRLTERFYRVNATASRELGGTGLGLAIVKHIVNRHRGQLDIRSEIGKGATFELSFEPWNVNGQ